jgi:hypothetical protein
MPGEEGDASNGFIALFPPRWSAGPRWRLRTPSLSAMLNIVFRRSNTMFSVHHGAPRQPPL